jgi:DNA-binding transcriptional LysR family regulator
VLSAFPPVPREEGLVYEELAANPMVYVTRADHPLVRRRSVALATLAQERWILVSRPAVLRELLNTAFDRAGVPPPPVPLVATSMHFLRAVLCEGRFVSLLPRDIVEEDLRAGRLAVVHVAETPRPARSG